MKAVIILGTARKDGKTENLIHHFEDISGFDLVDLNNYDISYFDYEHLNKNDDYLPLMKTLIEKYDVFIFATPVYWYAMSANMKTFFDRFTDLLTIEKEWGRKLRGKSMAALSSSSGGNLGEDFWIPFIKTSEYLGMNYLGNLHAIDGKDHSEALEEFTDQLYASHLKFYGV